VNFDFLKKAKSLQDTKIRLLLKYMLVEMKAESQITLPKEIIKTLGIIEGDKFEVMERDGGVFLCPVVVYSEAKLEQISKIIKDHEKNPSAVFENVEDMFKDIGIDLGNGGV
jgi:AbrB family looped-hinge helix DNA binding protein